MLVFPTSFSSAITTDVLGQTATRSVSGSGALVPGEEVSRQIFTVRVDLCVNPVLKIEQPTNPV